MHSLLRSTTCHMRSLATANHACPAIFSKSFSTMGLKERGIQLMVCDMAGTTIDEGGAVYIALRKAMNIHGLDVHEDEMHPWHGVKKGAVIDHFVKDRGMGESSQIEATFEKLLKETYFGPDSPLNLINPNLREYFAKLRSNGIKVALNTGYPEDIQEELLDKLKMRDMCDAHISAYQVNEGRPYPYMIYHLMERFGIKSAQNVVKVGDTVADIGEGLNSGCGYTVGVESGADTASTLQKAGADVVLRDVTCIKI